MNNNNEISYFSHRKKIKSWPIQPVLAEKPLALKRDHALENVHKDLRKYFNIVGYDRFIDTLKLSWKKAYSSLKDAKYALFFSNNSDIHKKSEHWVAGLLLENCKTFQPHYADLEDKEIKNFVIVDDASYSGGQITVYLDNLCKKINSHEKKNIHAIVPFISNAAEKLVLELNNKYNIEINIHSAARIFSLDERKEEIMSHEGWNEKTFQERVKDLRTMPEKIRRFKKSIRYMTLFAHKIADDQSLGSAVGKKQGDFQPPYRKNWKNYTLEAVQHHL